MFNITVLLLLILLILPLLECILFGMLAQLFNQEHISK
jgi:hypothetical protein